MYAVSNLVVIAQGVADRVAIDATIDAVLADTVRVAATRGVQCIGVSAGFDLTGLTYQHDVPFIVDDEK